MALALSAEWISNVAAIQAHRHSVQCVHRCSIDRYKLNGIFYGPIFSGAKTGFDLIHLDEYNNDAGAAICCSSFD